LCANGSIAQSTTLEHGQLRNRPVGGLGPVVHKRLFDVFEPDASHGLRYTAITAMTTKDHFRGRVRARDHRWIFHVFGIQSWKTLFLSGVVGYVPVG
jgi:hypothetical protein